MLVRTQMKSFVMCGPATHLRPFVSHSDCWGPAPALCNLQKSRQRKWMEKYLPAAVWKTFLPEAHEVHCAEMKTKNPVKMSLCAFAIVLLAYKFTKLCMSAYLSSIYSCSRSKGHIIFMTIIYIRNTQSKRRSEKLLDIPINLDQKLIRS